MSGRCGVRCPSWRPDVAVIVTADRGPIRIGIIGASEIGGTLAALLVGVGHEVVLANSRGPESLADSVGALGSAARAGTAEEAARAGEIVMLAIPFNRYLKLPLDPFDGQIVVDAGNYDIGRDGHVAALDRGETSSGQVLAAHLSGAKVFKASTRSGIAGCVTREDRTGSLADEARIPKW